MEKDHLKDLLKVKWAEPGGFPLGDPNQKVAVACSGGIDSTFLFSLSADLHKEGFWHSLGLVHVNYHLRGKDSENDEEFCRNLAQKHGAFFHLLSVAENKPQSHVQEWARHIRFAFFKELQKEGWTIAIAHTASDVLENILFRLSRGASIEHARGMSTWKDGFFRPLLEVSRAQIDVLAQKAHMSYRLDDSNRSNLYTRNRIRNTVVEPLIQEFPLAPNKWGEMFSLAEDVYRTTKKILLAGAGFSTDHPYLNVSYVAKQNEGCALLLIRSFIDEVAPQGPLNVNQAQLFGVWHICKSLKKTSEITLPAGYVVYRRGDQLGLARVNK